jgi:hypothetical protein
MKMIPLSEQDRLIRENHTPSDAVLALLKSLYDRLELARQEMHVHNYGTAEDIILEVMDVLPQTERDGPHDQPWPTKRTFCVNDLITNPAYKSIWDIETKGTP